MREKPLFTLTKIHPTLYTCPNPLNSQVMFITKGGTIIITKKQRKNIRIEAHHHDASYVGR